MTRLLARYVTGLAPLLLLSHLAAQEAEEVGRFTGEEHLEVQGATAFSPAAIALGVGLHPLFSEASHPRAPVAGYLKLIEDVITGGYQRSGFPQARVRARLDEERGTIRVAIQEGQRLLAADIIVTGNVRLGSETLIRAFSEPATVFTGGLAAEAEANAETALWVRDRPAAFDAFSEAAYRLRVVEAYALEGIVPRARVALRPAGEGKVDLHIAVREESPPRVIGRVLLEGAVTDPAEALEERLGLQAGTVATSRWLAGLRERIQAAGRYLGGNADLIANADTGKHDLRLRLAQAPFAPPWGAPEPEAKQVLRRAFDWLRGSQGWGRGVTLRVDGAALLERQDLQSILDSLQLEAALAESGAYLQLRFRYTGQDDSERAGLFIGKDRGVLVATPIGMVSRFELGDSLGIVSNIALEPRDPEGSTPGGDNMKLTVGMGFSPRSRATDPRLRLRLVVPEVSLTYLVTSDRVLWSPQGSALDIAVVRPGGLFPVASIDRASGAIRWSLSHEVQGAYITLATAVEEPGLEAEKADGLARQRGLREVNAARLIVRAARHVSMLRTGLRMGAQPGVLFRLLEGVTGDDAAAAIASYLRGLVPWHGMPQGEDVFPTVGPRTLQAAHARRELPQILAAAARRLAADFPPGSWPRVLLREIASLAAGGGAHTERELRHLLGSKAVGPMGYWAAAELLRWAGLAEQSTRFAREALRECAPGGIQKEIAMLRTPGTLPARVLESLGRELLRVPATEWDSLERDGASGDATEARFLEHLRRARKAREPGEAASMLLEGCWAVGLEEALRHRARELTGE